MKCFKGLFIFIIFAQFTVIYASNDDEKCEQHATALQTYHKRLMDYSIPNNDKKYLDLLREKNSIKAAMTLTGALVKIADEYYDYLSSVSTENIRKISDLQILLQAEAPAAARMTYAVDMMTAVGDDEITGNRQERFTAIASRLQRSCRQNNNISFCKNLSSNFWTNLTSNEQRSDVTHDAMVEQFIHVSAASGDIGTQFIEDPRFNELMRQDPATNATFTSLLSRAVDEAAKNCADVDLLYVANPTGSENKCLNLKLEDLRTIDGNSLRAALGETRSEVVRLGDVVSNYLERVNKVRDGQLQMTGELISKYRRLSTANFDQGDSQLKDNARRLRNEFDEMKTFLAGSIHGAFKLASSSNNLQALLNGAGNESGTLNPHSEDILDNLNNVTKDLTGLPNDLFDIGPDGKIEFSRSTLADALASDKLRPRQLREMTASLETRLANVEREIEKFKRQDGFNVLGKLQEFTWENVRYYCGDRAIDRENSGGPCSYKSGYNHGIDQLLETSNNMNRLERLEEEEQEIEELLSYCNNPQSMASQREVLDTTCSLVFARREDIRDRRQQELDRIQRYEEFIAESTTYPVFERDDGTGEMVVVERRPRINWLKQGLSRGFASAVQTIVPTGIEYFNLKGSLLQTVGMAQSRITYQAFAAAQATYPPQNACPLYMCGIYNYQISPTISVQPYYTNNGYINPNNSGIYAPF